MDSPGPFICNYQNFVPLIIYIFFGFETTMPTPCEIIHIEIYSRFIFSNQPLNFICSKFYDPLNPELNLNAPLKFESFETSVFWFRNSLHSFSLDEKLYCTERRSPAVKSLRNSRALSVQPKKLHKSEKNVYRQEQILIRIALHLITKCQQY